MKKSRPSVKSDAKQRSQIEDDLAVASDDAALPETEKADMAPNVGLAKKKSTPLMAAAIKEAKRRKSQLIPPPLENPTTRRPTRPQKTPTRRLSEGDTMTVEKNQVKEWRAAAAELAKLKEKEEERRLARQKRDRERRERQKSAAMSYSPSPTQETNSREQDKENDSLQIVTIPSSDEEVKSESSDEYESTPLASRIARQAVTTATTAAKKSRSSVTAQQAEQVFIPPTAVTADSSACDERTIARVTPTPAFSRDEMWALYHGAMQSLESEKRVSSKERDLSLKLLDDLRRAETEHVRVERALYAEQFKRQETALQMERQRSLSLQAELDRERARQRVWQTQARIGSVGPHMDVNEPYVPAFVGSGAATFGAVSQDVGPQIISDITLRPATTVLGPAAVETVPNTATDSNNQGVHGGAAFRLPEL